MRLYALVLAGVLALVLLVGLVLVLSLGAFPLDAAAQQSPPVAGPAIFSHREAVTRALTYLRTQQLADGGIESSWVPGTPDDFTTIKTLIALAAAGHPASFLTSVDGATPLHYLATQAITFTHDVTGTLFPGRAGMLAVSVVAGDGNPHAFGGMNIIKELVDSHHPATGAYSTTAKQEFSSGAAGTVNQAWAILGLAAALETVPVSVTGFLLSLQEVDGGWGYGFGGDVDATALAIQALVASGNIQVSQAELQQALTFLRSAQAASGGWEAWGELSADSTAAAIQAVTAAGFDATEEGWSATSGRTPHADLADLQGPDGSFGGNALGTAHAVPGLLAVPLPVYGPAHQEGRVGLVVDLGSGCAITRCVGFSGSEIAGFEVLMRSGLDVFAAFDPGAGAAVCWIEGAGCPADDCFCAYPDFWSYWHLVDREWVFSQVGSSSYTVRSGEVEGWSWGAGEPPPVVTFRQVCGPAVTDTAPPTIAPLDTAVPPTAMATDSGAALPTAVQQEVETVATLEPSRARAEPAGDQREGLADATAPALSSPKSETAGPAGLSYLAYGGLVVVLVVALVAVLLRRQR